jgi:hypothetical protein
MGFFILLVVVILGLAIAVVVFRRRRVTPPAPVETEPIESMAAREARHQVIELRGTELLERRVELDARRGTLTGDTSVDDALIRLELRFHAGEISEDEFEARKIKILGG